MKNKLINILLFISVAFSIYGQQTKYVFYFIGDGMGLNHVNGTEMYIAEKGGNNGINSLCFTQFPISNFATSFSANSFITDSGAAGTALASGVKTNNGSIGVDENGKKVYSIASKAKKTGKKVGVISNVGVDNATPAAFYAHQKNRSMTYEIATDLPKSEFDFFAGSGFELSKKKEKATIYKLFSDAGYTVVKGYDDYKAKLHSEKIILIQKEGKNIQCFPYAMDRKADDLTLPQITEAAITTLNKNNKNGFFLMVEGGKIDWAAHSNDAATVFNEVIDLDKAVQVAFEFYKKHPKETLIIVTADHETGGLGLGSGPYALNLKALANQQVSLERLSAYIKELRIMKNHHVAWEDVRLLLREKLGFWKSLPITWNDEKILHDEFEESFVKNHAVYQKNMHSKNEPLAAKAIQILNKISLISWCSNGHSASHVPFYAIGAGSQLFNGKMDNTDIPKRIAKAANY
jgi:alkaline phosphatase